jgi:peptidoglycan-associated lipoprotein
MSRSSLTLLLFLFILKLYGQPVREIPLSKMIQTAEKSLENGDYYNALEWYEKVYKEKREPEYAYTIAMLHYTLRDYGRAETQLGRLLTTNLKGVRPPAEASYYYGQALKMNGKTREAKEAFTRFILEGKDQQLITRAGIEIEGIDQIDRLLPNKGIAVVNAGTLVNTPFTEASALLSRDSLLYFVSFQKKAPIVLDGKDNDYFAKIYTSKKNKEGKWGKPAALSDAINRPNTHTGHFSFNAAGDQMVFSRAELTHSEVTAHRLYYSQKAGDTWTPAREIKLPQGEFQIKDPAFAKMFDREVLLVSSNMPGGQGGYDLYYGNFDGENLGDLSSLGPKFNSPGDEITPFYTRTHLYFSSDGRPGMGGFDIYAAEWNGVDYGTPTNLGRNFNTSLDDMYYTLNPDGNTGFLVSNRQGTRSLKSKTCCDDIFYFSLQPILVDLMVTVFETPKKPLKGSQIRVEEFVEESSFEKERKTNDQSHTFQFDIEVDKAYQLVVSREGFYPDTIEVNTVGILESTNLKKEVILRPLPPEPTTEIISIKEPIRLNNIYYDYDDATILKDAELDLSPLLDLLKEYPTMVIELSSHTDAQGNDDYNKRLSQRRANSAKKWLTDRGITSDRIKAIGFGETKILNHCKNGVRCNDTEHRFNRRTEFRILEGPQTITIKKEVFKTNTKPAPVNSQGGAAAPANPAPRKKGVPILKWESPFHDFGVVNKGDDKLHEFSFTNTGDADLIIEIATACECTDLDYPTKAIKPGQKGTVKANFHSKEKNGETEITINVIANTDPIVSEARFRAFVKE